MNMQKPSAAIGAMLLALNLAAPAEAAKPECGDGRCQGKENPSTCPEDCSGGGEGNDVLYDVQVIDSQESIFEAPTWAPGCLAETRGGY